jgi:signal transduction histidine kinase
MLGIYRITSRPIEPEAIDMSEIASGIADDLLVQNRDLDLRIDVEPGLAATADPVLAHLMLENLLGNAVKYSSKKASARVRLRAVPADPAGCPDLVGFEVSDDGDGFDPASADRLFSAMTRLHGDEFPGTGLGLASVARIVELHGGTIRATGEKGVGATFTFTLPA